MLLCSKRLSWTELSSYLSYILSATDLLRDAVVVTGVFAFLLCRADRKPTTSPPLQLNPPSRESLNLEPHCALIKDPHHGLSRRTNLIHLCRLPHCMIMICTVCLLSRLCGSDSDSLCPSACGGEESSSSPCRRS